MLSSTEPPALRRKAATDKLVEKIVKHDSWPIQPDILNPPLLRLTSRKLLWLDLQPADIKSRWKHKWKLAQVVNSPLVCDPTILQLGFDLPRQKWSTEPFSHRTGTLQCLQKEMVTYRHWSVSLWRDSDDVSHCRILFSDKAEWRLISATLCRWRRCFVADQLWFMTHIREEEEECVNSWTVTDNIIKRQKCLQKIICVHFLNIPQLLTKPFSHSIINSNTHKPHN